MSDFERIFETAGDLLRRVEERRETGRRVPYRADDVFNNALIFYERIKVADEG